jgi:(R)-2-hydroxyacyl-CoA dehydratese activating ATPase
MDKPVIAGIDIGSRSIELVALRGGQRVHEAKVPTTFDPLGQCRKILADLPVDRIIATGYGRKLLADALNKELPVTTVTEIQAYALGAHHLYPETRTILDIGGQDTKVIFLSDQGKVAKFEMNDRCATGTEKFLEFMAAALQISIESFGDYALRADRRIKISSRCTVFAESEATSLVARGERPENIALGLHLAIVQRTLSMLGRVGKEPPLMFAGGVAHNPCVRKLFEEETKMPIIVPKNPDMVGALRAALYGIGICLSEDADG